MRPRRYPGYAPGPLPHDYSHVIANLWTGGMPMTTPELDALAERGITTVVNLADEYRVTAADLYGRDGRFAYHPNPTPDDGRWKPLVWFATSAAGAGRALARGDGVYVHCLCGSNRGPATAYYLLRMMGFQADDAERLVRLARPHARLMYLPDAEEAAGAALSRPRRHRAHA